LADNTVFNGFEFEELPHQEQSPYLETTITQGASPDIAIATTVTPQARTSRFSPRLGKRKRTSQQLPMTSERSQPQEHLSCPIFRHETDRGLPHRACKGGSFKNMSELRLHMTRGSKRYPSHLKFLRQCEICKHDFIDEELFVQRHDERCNSPRSVRKGDAAKIHYTAFTAMILAYHADGTKTSTCKCA
jgi:hypothetical protein